jgi:hypothetical protein
MTLGALTGVPSEFERSASNLAGSIGPSSLSHSPLGDDARGFVGRRKEAAWSGITGTIGVPRKGDVLIHRTAFIAWTEGANGGPTSASGKHPGQPIAESLMDMQFLKVRQPA